MKSAKNPEYDALKLILVLGLAAGLAQLALLPIGLCVGVGGMTYFLVWGVHLLLHASSVVLAGRVFFKLLRSGKLLAVFTLIFFCCFVFFESLVPVTARDALIHHLALLRWWSEAGKIVQIPWHEWSYYPAGLHLGFLGFFELGSAQLIVPYHASYLLVGAFALSILITVEYQRLNLAAPAFYIALTTPVILELAGSPLVDAGMYAAVSLAIMAFWSWNRSNRPADSLIGAAYLGLAAGFKYNGLLAAVAFGLLALLLAPKSRSLGSKLAVSLCSALICILVFAPWALRNQSWIRNPVYPLYRGVFESNLKPPLQNNPGPLQYRIQQYGESKLEVALLPLRMLVSGKSGDPKNFDGVATPLFLLAVFAFILARQSTLVVSLSLASVLYAALALCSTAARVRYMLPIFPALLLLSAATWEAVFSSRPAANKIFGLIALILHTYLAAVSMFQSLPLASQLSFVRNDITRERFLQQEVPGYNCISRTNSSLNQTDGVYLAYTGNYFYLYSAQARGNYQSLYPAARVLRDGAKAQELFDWFTAQHVNYLLLSPQRTQAALDSLLRPQEKIGWNDFLKFYTKFEWAEPNCILLKLEKQDSDILSQVQS